MTTSMARTQMGRDGWARPVEMGGQDLLAPPVLVWGLLVLKGHALSRSVAGVPAWVQPGPGCLCGVNAFWGGVGSPRQSCGGFGGRSKRGLCSCDAVAAPAKIY